MPCTHQKWEERMMVAMGQKGWRQEVHMLSDDYMYLWSKNLTNDWPGQ